MYGETFYVFEVVGIANDLLREELKYTRDIHFWKLKGLKRADNLLNEDGVHLTDKSRKSI